MGLIERPTNDDPRVHRLAQVLARSAWPGDSNRDLRELERHVYALEAQLAGAVDLIRELRGWADTYEDHMGPDDFTRRAKVFARADAFLRGQ